MTHSPVEEGYRFQASEKFPVACGLQPILEFTRSANRVSSQPSASKKADC
jgi:hypothetical protein